MHRVRCIAACLRRRARLRQAFAYTEEQQPPAAPPAPIGSCPMGLAGGLHREPRLPTYIALANWTDQGAKQVKELPQRVELARKTLERHGRRVPFALYDDGRLRPCPYLRGAGRRGRRALYLVLGQFGTVRTRTLKAFPEAAYREIIHSLR